MMPQQVAPEILSQKTITCINYANTDNVKHQLDLYIPATKDFPTVVYIHGGSWTSGSKEEYGGVGTYLQTHGIGCAVINYRLSPEVVFPSHAEDVAMAIAWVKKHIGGYRGNGKIILVGHSAGGFLGSCMATDEKYLRAVGLSNKDIAGVVSISGIYLINYNVNFYGVGHVFNGCDKAKISPINNVHTGMPPFLIFYADKDIPTFEKQAKNFHAKLLKFNNNSKLRLYPGNDHSTIIIKLFTPKNTFEEEFLNFITK